MNEQLDAYKMDIDATKIGTNSLIAAQNKQIENLGKKIQEL